MPLYLIANGPMPTTAAFAGVTTGTAIKTMLQAKPFNIAKIKEWGFFLNAFAAAAPVTIELIETDVAATVTAHADADITKLDDPAGAAAASVAGLTLGTAATGYTASAEGAITAVRMLDAPRFILPTDREEKQFVLGNEPKIQVGKYARIRVTSAAAYNMICYMVLEI